MSVVVINAVTVPEEAKAGFEERFAQRKGHVSRAPGFEAFELLRPHEGDQYLVYTRWRSHEDFQAWRTSADFRAGHRPEPGEARPPGSGQPSELWTLDVVTSEYTAG
jgi:heme-degrading monooxygenase HmoA